MQLNAKNSALVLIDLQRGVLAMPIQPHSADTIYQRSMRLAQRCRDAGVLIVHVRVSFARDFADALQPTVDQPSNVGALPSGWDELPEVPPSTDLIITKRQWGAFYGTELDLQLRRRGIGLILLGGIATNIGVESTARSAAEHGYELVVLEDLCGGHTSEMHAFSFAHIMPRLARVSTSDAISLA